MKNIRIAIILSLILAIFVTYSFVVIKGEGDRFSSEDPRVWDPVITEMKAQDDLSLVSKNPVLFIGSSSIRFWDTLKEDMQPLTVVGRGFGGAKIMDVSFYIERLITPYKPRAIVVYVGSNDLSDVFNNQPKTTDQVKKLYFQLVERIHSVSPGVPIFIIALKPGTANWHNWDQYKAVNDFLLSLQSKDPLVHFIDANEKLFTQQGEPDGSLIGWDTIHMNAKGYKVWGEAIKTALLAELH